MPKVISTYLETIQRDRFVHLGVGASYFAASLATFYLYNVVSTQPAVVFSPVGIAIAAVIIWGYSVTPAIVMGYLASAIMSGTQIPLMAANAVAVALAPMATLFFLNKFRAQRAIDTPRDLIIFVIVVAITTTIIPTISYLSREVYATYIGSIQQIVWQNVWIAGFATSIVITPLIIREFRPLRRFTALDWLEGTLTVSALSGITFALSYLPSDEAWGVPLIFPWMIVLIWIALRLGTFFTTLGMGAVYAIAISGIFFGNDANPQNLTIPERIVAAETGIVLFSVIAYFISALEEGRRAAMKELEKYTTKLERSLDEKELDSEAKNEFIAVLGHEIRNPLASLLSSVEILKTRAQRGDLESERTLESMEDRIRSMGRLLDDIFDISRITRKKMVLKKADIRARDTLRRAAESVQPYMSKNKHRFDCTLPDKNVILHADPVRIEQIVTNLLYNAAKYTPAGGMIDFSTTFEREPADPSRGEIVIRVRDTGVGLTEEEQDKIFEPFTQINPKQSLMGGIGLGLTLSKNLVEMHSGSIEVQSDGLGRGSEFIVRLPASIGRNANADRPTPTPPATPALPTKPAPSAKQHLIVVDDNVDAARGLCKLLEFHGHNVSVAHDGSEALSAASASKADAIVLDIGLPDMDGYEVAKALRGRGESATLIALSGYGQDDHRRRAREAGFDYYLTKPISVEEILSILQKRSNVKPLREGAKGAATEEREGRYF